VDAWARFLVLFVTVTDPVDPGGRLTPVVESGTTTGVALVGPRSSGQVPMLPESLCTGRRLLLARARSCV